MTKAPEACPVCGETSAVRPKLILIDEAWTNDPSKDPHEVYFSYIRADDIRPEHLREHPFHQFIDGFYCDRCKKGFISEEILKENRRHYR
jgi:hypothetical protein